MKCPYCVKQCTKCNKLLVAWKGNFNKAKKGKWGLVSKCKECCKQYYEENKEELLEKQKQYREEHKEQIAEQNKKYREEHKEEIAEYQKQYYKDNKEELLEYKKQYREEHKEEIAEKKKEWYEEHKEEIEFKEKRKKYREENKEQITVSKKEWCKNNPHKVFNYCNKRRNKLENQGRGITKEQWYEMMNFFGWKCAYSGEYIGGDSEFRTIDHIVPIDSGGLNEPWNCVPCFSSYNFSKHINNMEEWYIKQEYFSEENLVKIYTWIEYAYKKWKPRRKGNKKFLHF